MENKKSHSLRDDVRPLVEELIKLDKLNPVRRFFTLGASMKQLHICQNLQTAYTSRGLSVPEDLRVGWGNYITAIAMETCRITIYGGIVLQAYELFK